MAIIIYLDDNGEKQVATQITTIAHLGIQGDSDAKALAKYIRQGLTQLAKGGVPADKELLMIGEEENGDLRTFHLLKPLTSQYPLNEFRVNRSSPGAFRAIFFEYEYKGEQLLIFTKSVLKKGDPNPPEFQIAIKESEFLYKKFHKNPRSYLGEDV